MSQRSGRVGPLKFLTLAVGVASILLTACTSSDSVTQVVTPAPQAPTTAPAAASPTAGEATPVTGAAVPAVQIKGPYSGEAKTLDGAGATFPTPLYTKWFAEYDKLTGVKINYQSVGSGGGIKAISDQTVDFGASDATMTDEQLKAAKGGELFHIPAALGAVVATYNIPGFTAKM